ncbi:MAG: SMP-30/gluconolactonase/LRE family protein [Rhodospirillaceae bacterium]|nr:SMP-30/gluconolactonase/LRE family protein [Rhodospirillaceae bacterium]
MIQKIQPTVFYKGLHFGECLRFRGNALWLSDMQGFNVLKFTTEAQATSVLRLQHEPSGLGWLPGGDLLVVSMPDAKVLRWNGHQTDVYADLGPLSRSPCNDMLVDKEGRCYVGNFGFDYHAGESFDAGVLMLIDANGVPSIIAENLLFPNGMAEYPDGKTLLVAESGNNVDPPIGQGAKLTAFDKLSDGTLMNRRTWSTVPDACLPDGICLDVDGGVWIASPTTKQCLRVKEGGEITHIVEHEQIPVSCALGGRTLYTATCDVPDPEFCRNNPIGCITVNPAPSPGITDPGI